jgi:Kdo2-lipid IVA lauroyltransferase/acyltransferase
MNLILSFLLIFFITILGLIPFFILYPLSDLVSFVLYRIVGYRKSVVRANLKQSFPHLDKRSLRRLEKLSYKNLSDVLLEGIKGFTMTRGQILRRHLVVNPEILDSFKAVGRTVITLPSHYGNWEWGSLSPGLYIKEYKIVAFYKPLTNPYADRFVRTNRSRTGTTLASIYKTNATFDSQKNELAAYIMAADQSPSNTKNAVWINFLGRETAFLHGPEKYATRYNYPVFFVDIQRVKRGYYQLELSLLSDNPAELEPGEITRLYAAKLEEVILKKPENWLWSHRRWKLSR